MRLLILLSFVFFCLAHARVKKLKPRKQYYHETVGIKMAALIMELEEAALRTGNQSKSKLGEPKPVPIRYPYYGGLVITLIDAFKSVCGSALISGTALITAAQCWFDGMYQAALFEVVLGSAYLYQGGLRIVTSNVIVHGDYNNISNHNDIAVIRVPFIDIGVLYIRPIALPLYDKDIHVEGLWVDNMGYGLMALTYISTLTGTTFKVVPSLDCETIYGQFFEEMICAKTIVIGGPCKGDYGSPLSVDIRDRPMVIGINSFIIEGNHCEKWPPVGFTKVYPYKEWIKGVMRASENQRIPF